ncbi:MAG: ATP-binding protein, partial [Mycobacterium sp.]
GVWDEVRLRATSTVADRFRVTKPLRPLPSADIGRAILERRFTASYRTIEFVPPYPSWPIRPSAFEDAPSYTPRQLLKRADTHVRSCLDRGVVEELKNLSDTSPRSEEEGTTKDPSPIDNAHIDRLFNEYRRRAVVSAPLDPEGENLIMPGLLSAVLQAWIIERGETEQTFRLDPPPGRQAQLHGRLRQSLDANSDDERHWAFRAIAHTHAGAVQSRIKNAVNAAGFGPNLNKRKLFLLRNGAWPSGPKTYEVVAAFEAAGGRTLPLSEDDVRTATALRDLVDDDDADLPRWLVERKPAHGLAFLRGALGEGAGPPPTKIPDPPASELPPREPHDAEPDIDYAVNPAAVPLGIDETARRLVEVELAALRKHVVIFAGSGSGKTVLIRRLVEECALRGVSSIVLDPNNDLSRLGSPWPELPNGWNPADEGRAAKYFSNTEVVVWTPRKNSGRPVSFQPLPDFASVRDDEEELDEAVESAVAALEPRAIISGSSAKAKLARAVLVQALRTYGLQGGSSLQGFIRMLGDLPDDVSDLGGAAKLAAELGQNLNAATVNDPMFGGSGTPADPAVLLTPSSGYRARVSVINMVGLTSDEQRQGFVNQLQMALFSWIKRNPAGGRPLGGLLVMDEAQNFAPSGRSTPCLRSTLALSSQARKYGLGLVYATQAPKGLHPHIPGNATTQFFGLLNSPVQIAVAHEIARVKGGRVPDIGKLRAGNFYTALEGEPFHKIRAPWCLSYHPASPPTTEEVLDLARRNP